MNYVRAKNTKHHMTSALCEALLSMIISFKGNKGMNRKLQGRGILMVIQSSYYVNKSQLGTLGLQMGKMDWDIKMDAACKIYIYSIDVKCAWGILEYYLVLPIHWCV